MEHRGFALALDALGQGAALGLHWRPIHYRTRSNPPCCDSKNNHPDGWLFFGGDELYYQVQQRIEEKEEVHMNLW